MDKSSLKKDQKNRLLYLLEKASILERMGDSKKSRALLIEADKVVDELYTLSLSKEATTYLLNEAAQAYGGEDYEKVAIHTMMAMSFLNTKEIASARVEARRINTRLNEINSAYTKANTYREDAFGRYLAGMIYESRGEWDSAIIDYQKALNEYQATYQKEFKTPPPKSLIQALYRLLIKRSRTSASNKLKDTYHWLVRDDDRENFGEVLVLHQVGHIANKVRQESLHRIGKELIRFSFPAIKPKLKYSLKKTGVESPDSPFIKGELVQNFDYIAAKTLDDRKGRLILKAGARLILKSQMSQAAEKKGGPLLGLAFNIFGAVSETADTRQWTSLPSSVHVSRLRLRPGTHNLKVFTDGKLMSVSDVTIAPSKMNFIIAI